MVKKKLPWVLTKVVKCGRVISNTNRKTMTTTTIKKPRKLTQEQKKKILALNRLSGMFKVNGGSCVISIAKNYRIVGKTC